MGQADADVGRLVRCNRHTSLARNVLQMECQQQRPIDHTAADARRAQRTFLDR